MRTSKSATEIRTMYSDIRDIEFMDYSEYKRLRTVEEENNRPPTLLSTVETVWVAFTTRVKEKYCRHKGIIIVILSIMLGSMFYAFSNDWDASTSIFYAANALLGILYMVSWRSQRPPYVLLT